MKLYSATSGTGPAVILIHGIFGMGSNLSVIAKALESDYTVITLDMRNHGRSERADTMTYDDMAQDVAEFMGQQGLRSAHFLGHSMGGKVAMQLAVSEPQLVEKLIVSDIAPVEYPAHHSEILAGLNHIDTALLTSRKEADEQLASHVSEPFIRQYLLKNLYRVPEGEKHAGAFAWRINLPVISAYYDNLRMGLTTGKPFHGPTLFVKGEHSNYIRTDSEAAIRQWFPNARLKIIQGAGHWLHADKPTAFNQVAKKFLAEPVCNN